MYIPVNASKEILYLSTLISGAEIFIVENGRIICMRENFMLLYEHIRI